MNKVHSAASGSIPVGDRHIGLLQILLLGVMLGFVVAWSILAGWLLVFVLAYGLVGEVINPPSARFMAFAFSAVFVFVTALGSISWVADKAKSSLKIKDTTHDR